MAVFTLPPPAAPPVVTAISPASGPVTGGTSVTITGTRLTAATAVTFGTTPATTFTVRGDTQITATAPAATSPGTVHVTITTPAGTSPATPAGQYTYQPAFAFTGFQPPIASPPALNHARAGQAIPVKFSLGANLGPDIIAPGYPTATQIDCTTGVPVSAPAPTATAGGTGLHFDPATSTYTYIWKTSKTWARTCQQLNLTLTDGTTHLADFQFR